MSTCLSVCPPARPSVRPSVSYRVFIKYCNFVTIAFLCFLSVSVCVHTRQVEHRRCSRTGIVQKIHKILRKNTIFNEHPVLEHVSQGECSSEHLFFDMKRILIDMIKCDTQHHLLIDCFMNLDMKI